MAPEQARGDTKHLDRRTDVYALGVTLYELLAGQSPYTAESEVDLLVSILVQEPRPPRMLDKAIPADLEAVTLKCLEKEPGARYDSAKALAEDLGRYLDGEPVLARRVGLLRRLYRRARRQKLLTALGAALLASLLALAVYSARTRLANLERERQARQQAELAQRLGQAIKDMEWTLRSARQLPLHDLGREKRIVRQQMAQLQAELASYGELGRGLAHYALGRGHMALHEYPQALAHLQQTMASGYENSEVHYALGFVLGKHFEKALYEARLSGGGDWARKRLKEIEPKYLIPSLTWLKTSRTKQPTEHHYLDGLIAFYKRDYGAALMHAEDALREAPWLYEARKLAGDVHLEQALQARDSGRYQEAEQKFATAVRSYEEAAEMGRSDGQVYEGLAEAWVRQIEMSTERGQPSDVAYSQAMAASGKLRIAEPDSIAGLLKQAYAAQMTMALTGAGLSSSERVQQCLSAAKAVLERQPENPYASDLAAVCYANAAEDAQAHGQDPKPLLKTGIDLLEPIIRRHPYFLWGINDLAVLYATLADHLALSGDLGAKEKLEKSLDYYSMAQDLDPSYLKSYANALSSFSSLVAITTSSLEIDALLARAERVFARCAAANKQNPSCLNNHAITYTIAAKRAYQAGQDAEPHLAQARKSFAVCRTLGTTYLDTEQYTVMAHLIDAGQRVRQEQDPGPALADMQAALRRCFATAADDALCAILASQADWVAAERQAQQNQPALPVLQQALSKAVHATQVAAPYPEAWQGLAETHLRLATAKRAAGTDPSPHLTAGLEALDKVFAINPNHAQGLATLGALLMLRAQVLRDPATRRAAARSAASALDRALKLDPALSHTYSPLLAKAKAAAAPVQHELPQPMR